MFCLMLKSVGHRHYSLKLQHSLKLSGPTQVYCFIKRQFTSASSFSSPDTSDIALAYTTYPLDAEKLDTSKRSMIILHGVYGTRGPMHALAKHFSSDGNKVVTFDARNHGDSGHHDRLDYQCMSDDLEDLIQELQLGQPVVLGHSMGGKTAMVTALNKPDILSSLILVDIIPFRGPTPKKGENKDYDILSKFGHLANAIQIPQVKGLSQARKAVQLQMASHINDREFLSYLLACLEEFPDGSIKWKVNLDVVTKNLDTIFAFPDLWDKSCSKPSLFVFGEESQVYSMLDKGLLQQLFPSHELASIPGAGHMVHTEKPLEFVTIVREFLKTL